MRYFSMFKGETETEELSKERAKQLLEACYEKDFIADIFDNDKSFRLQTMTRTIWTKTDNGMDPKEIRALTGLSQVKFGQRYGIPRRTVEAWEMGINKPPTWAAALLERAVKEDYPQDPKDNTQ